MDRFEWTQAGCQKPEVDHSLEIRGEKSLPATTLNAMYVQRVQMLGCSGGAGQ